MTEEAASDIDLSGGVFGLLGGVIDEIAPNRVVLTMPADKRHHQPYGLVHGGVYCLLVESAASIGAAHHAVGMGYKGAVGVSNTTDFLRAHRTGAMTAVATPIHQGRTQQLWAVSVTRVSDGKELATGRVRLQNIRPTQIGSGQRNS